MAHEKRLISAKEMERQVKVAFQDNPYLMGQLLRWIRKQPTVDAVEVVHGRWEEHSRTDFNDYLGQDVIWSSYQCSACGFEAMNNFNYCPNCGADMRERKDDGQT